MSFWKKLKELIKLENVHINVNFSPRIHIGNIDSSKKIIVNKKEKKIEINISKFSPPKIQKLITQATKEGYSLVEDRASETLLDFGEKEQDLHNQQLLDFFRNKIPEQDIYILRASLYIKKLRGERKNVDALKWQIMDRYGERGKNIVNLCSAGYFESLIKPLYEHMNKQPRFSGKKFLSIYNRIVEEHAFAIFVHRNMTKSALKSEIEKRIKYAIQTFNIHALGKQNIEKIKDTILAIEKERKYLFSKSIEEGRDYIIVELRIVTQSSGV